MGEMDNLKKEKEVDEKVSREMSASLKDRLAVLHEGKNKISEPVATVELEPPVAPPISVEPIVPAEPVFDGEITDDEIQKGDLEMKSKEIDLETEEWAKNLKVDDIESEIGVEKKMDLAELGISPEQDKRLMELGKRLESDRLAYVKKEVEIEKSGLHLGRVFQMLNLGLGGLKRDRDDLKKYYEASKKDYKNELMKSAIGDEKEAEIMADWIVKYEYAKLEKDRIEERAEQADWIDSAKRYYLKAVEKYSKLPVKTKIALGLGIGAGLSFAGGAIVGAALVTGKMSLAVSAVSRTLGFSASAIGFKNKLEDKAQKERKQKEKKETAEVIEESKIGSGGSFEMGVFNNLLDKKMAESDDRINKERKAELWRTTKAIGYGGALSTVGYYLGKWVGGNFREWMSHSDGEVPIVGKSISPTEQVVGGNLATGSVGAENLVEAKPSSISLFVGESGSMGTEEGPIKHYLETHPNLVEKYNQLDPKGRTFDAGQVAHRMALQFAEEQKLDKGPFSLTHAGAEIRINPETMQIESISDPKGVGWLPDNKGGSSEIFSKTEVSSVHAEIPVPPAESATGLDASVSADIIDIEPEALQKINEVVSQRNMDAVSDYSPDILQKMALDSDAKFIKSIKDYAFGNDAGLWSAERDVPVKNILANESSSPAHEKMLKFFNHLMKIKNIEEIPKTKFDIFKNQLRPKGDEQLFKWMIRIAKLTREYKITKL